jgi:signal transduction histidine kinase
MSLMPLTILKALISSTPSKEQMRNFDIDCREGQWQDLAAQLRHAVDVFEAVCLFVPEAAIQALGTTGMAASFGTRRGHGAGCAGPWASGLALPDELGDETTQQLTLGQVRRDPRFPPLPAQFGALDPQLSCRLVPVRIASTLRGVLLVVSRTGFHDSERLLPEVYAEQVALHFQNRQLLADQRLTMRALQDSQQLIAAAEERTRREISEVLHSRVQSRLLVAWYRLGEVQLAHPEFAAQLDAVRRDLEDLREHDLRSISHQLHPEALRVGLVAALQVFVTQLQGMAEVVIDVDDATRMLDDPLSNKLSHPLRLIIFRSIEEAIGNVLKHALASRIQVRLHSADSKIHVVVNDNGHGVDLAELTPGLGLLCLAARIDGSGGRWGLDSQPGGPTSLWLEVPL